MKEILKKIWWYLKGKKRNIGIVLLSLLDLGVWIFPDTIPEQNYLHIVALINILLLGGAADSKPGRKVLENIKNKLNGAK